MEELNIKTRDWTAPHVSPGSYRILDIWLRKHAHISPYVGAFRANIMPQ